MRACLLVLALGGCGTRESPAAPPTDTGADVEDVADVGIDVSQHDSSPMVWDSTDPPEKKDTDPGPVGHCLYDSIDWTCRAGHICTMIGRCTPDDAGPSEAGSEACGIIWCDKEYCRCRTPSVSLCDCN